MNTKSVIAGDTLVVMDENVSYVASKYDANNDEHFPKEGDVHETEDGKVVVKKAKFYSATDLLDLPEPSLDGFDGILMLHHPERPFVKYLAWCNKL